MRDFIPLLRDTYIEALEYGADPDEAFETALKVVYEVEPELDHDDARQAMSEIVEHRPTVATIRSLPPRRSFA